jgi:hypothetical protein
VQTEHWYVSAILDTFSLWLTLKEIEGKVIFESAQWDICGAVIFATSHSNVQMNEH